jgi:hypothetical protein
MYLSVLSRFFAGFSTCKIGELRSCGGAKPAWRGVILLEVLIRVTCNISARITYDAPVTSDHISSRTTVLCCEKSFGMSEYSKEYTFQILVRSEVLTAASMKMAVFWVVAPCSPVKVYQFQRFIRAMTSPQNIGFEHNSDATDSPEGF